eukprot:1304616-Pyramimonas_sp.AAC.1
MAIAKELRKPKLREKMKCKRAQAGHRNRLTPRVTVDSLGAIGPSGQCMLFGLTCARGGIGH